VTHDVESAARPQTTARDAARLPGEALQAPVDTNPVLVALARTVAEELRSRSAPSRDDLAAALGGTATPAVRSRVTTNVPLADGVGQRLAIDCGEGIVLDAVLVLPHGFADAAPGVLVTVDEGGKAVALAGPAAAAARARGFAVLAADLRGTGESAASEFELATAAWTLDRDLLAMRVDDLRACVATLSARYSTGQQIDKGRIVVHGDGPFGLVALLAAALDLDIAGAASTGFVRRLEDLLVESPALTPMAFPFAALATFDIPDLRRLASPRPLLAGGADDDPGAFVGALLDVLAAR
jgi:alpha-beta hydrolase superfamily lysophospholipase